LDPRLYEQLLELEQNHWWFRGRRAVLMAALQRTGSKARTKARTVLDCGCGAGGNLDILKAQYPNSEIHGVDIERGPLSVYHGELSSAYQADAARLPFGCDAFDVVSALDSIEHVEDDARALSELHRVCRPGGSLLLSAPAFGFLWGNVDDAGHHFRRYTRDQLAQRVRAAGFEISLLRYFNFLLFPPIAAIRLLARVLPKRPEKDGDDVSTDFDIVKDGPLNELLARVFSFEARLLGIRIPFGVSILVVGRKP